MKYAIDQIDRKPADLEANLQTHIECCKAAAEQQAKLIIFPELSLTGYNLADAQKQAFTLSDKRLNPLQAIADAHGMAIIAGAPVLHKDKLFLASLIIRPRASIDFYAKQHLHGEEQDYFETSTDYNPLINIGDEKYALAICADINYAAHSAAAKAAGATTYLASIYFESYEMDKAHRLLAAHAKANQMKVLMVNFTGTADGHTAGGKSGWWNQEGKLMHCLSSTAPDLVVVDI